MVWIAMIVFLLQHEFGILKHGLVDGDTSFLSVSTNKYLLLMTFSYLCSNAETESPYVGVVGEDAYLKWTISNLVMDTTRYIRNPAGNASLMVFFSNQLSPYIVDTRAKFTGDLLQGIVSFTLSNIKISDAGKYTFTKTAGTTTLILGAQVLVVAENPNILGIIWLSYSAVAGQEYKLNCSSESRSAPSNHNLTMHSEWKINGVNITTGAGYNINGTILTIGNLDRKDNGDKVTCRTFEDERKYSLESGEMVLNVFYGPDPDGINLYPEQSSFEQVEYFPFIINCSADCNPYCQYMWNGPGVSSNGNTSMLYIPEIKRNQTGVFTCTVTNPEITNKFATATIHVTVFYGPDTPLQLFPVNTSYRLVEGTTIPDIYCTSNCFPTCQLNWSGPVSSLNGVLSLGKVNRTMKGNYTCMGQNLRTHINTCSNVVTVDVIYGPDTPVLSPSNTEYVLNESNILPNISCSADCFPICSSFWYKDQTIVPVVQGNMLALGDVYRYDSGKYACRFENMESKAIGESAVQLIVQYPPTIILESRNGSISETGLMINCTAHGIPELYIFSLVHRSLFSGIEIRQLTHNEIVYTGVLVHSFGTPSFMDTGVYTCIVRNGVLDYKDQSLDKNVSMTVWIKGPPNVTSSETDFYAEKGGSGRLVIEFYNSLMDANVTWNKQRNQSMDKIESSEKYNISIASTNVTVQFYSVLIQQPGIIAILDIKNMTDEDFGSYHVYLENPAGNLTDLILKLRPKEIKKPALNDNGAGLHDSAAVALGICIPIPSLLIMVVVVVRYRRRLFRDGKIPCQNITDCTKNFVTEWISKFKDAKLEGEPIEDNNNIHTSPCHHHNHTSEDRQDNISLSDSIYKSSDMAPESTA